MKTIVSLFGDESPEFQYLNDRAAKYAASKNLNYIWRPMVPFTYEKAIAAMKEGDYGIIDIQKYDEQVFRQIQNTNPLLIRFGVGFDSVDLDAATKYGIAIARTTAANTIGVAELAVLLMLAAIRRLKENINNLNVGDWSKCVSHELYGSTVGIIGFGNIGKKVAQLLQGFSCRILVYDPMPNLDVIKACGAELVSYEDLCRQSDVITVHCVTVPSTYHLVDEAHLKLMKKTAVIVNTARGVLIDERALIKALEKGWIAGAALDVLETEPCTVDFPLIGKKNVILTPHAASQTFESLWRIYEMAIDIAADFRDGKDSPHILNPGYKNTAR